MEYPLAPENCFSLNRYFQIPSKCRQKPIWIAGQIIQILSDSVILQGQGRSLRLFYTHVERENFSGGDFAAFLVSEKFVLEKTQKIRTSQFIVQKSLRLTSCSGSFNLSCLAPKTAQIWSDFLYHVKQALNKKGLLEVRTPSLVSCPGLEPDLEPFETFFKKDLLGKKYFLPTSPELSLKKMLASGYTDIFEIRSCFRNGEVSTQHQPEFQMLEWYRSFSRLFSIEEDLNFLIRFLNKKGFVKLKQKEFDGEHLEFKRYSIRELFKHYLSFDLKPDTSQKKLKDLCSKKNLDFNFQDSWNDLFHLLFLSFIEPHLEKWGPLIIYDFPPSLSALARITEAGWADRFEFYWRGFELANAFQELNDPQIQKERFLKYQKERKIKKKSFVPIDEDFLNALRSGMPPSAGIALGLERLFLACQNEKDIARIYSFPMKFG